jgi:multiple sugar transport system substrate-binding protein
MTDPLEAPISRRALVKGAIGAAGVAAVGSLGSPGTAGARIRRKNATKVVVMTGTGELSKGYVEAFGKINPNIEIEVIPPDAARFQAMMAAGQPPDIWRTQAPLVPQWASRGKLLNLDPYFQNSDALRPADLTPANDYYRFKDGKQGVGPRYGMVKDWSPDGTVWINMELFRKTGIQIPGPRDEWSYDDLWEIAKKLKAKNKSVKWIIDLANSYAWVDRDVMVKLAAVGGSLYPKDFRSINLTKNKAALEAFRYLFQYSQQKMDLSPANPNPDGWSGPGFTTGKVAMTQYGYWFNGMMTGNATASAFARMLTAPVWKKGKKVDPTITATGWVVSATTKNPDAAWEVFEWYMGKGPARDRAGGGWGVPAQLSLFDRLPASTPVQRNAKRTLLVELPKSKVPIQYNPNLVGLGDSTAVAAAYQKYLLDAANGKISFNELMKRVERDTNAAIQVGLRG